MPKYFISKRELEDLYLNKGLTTYEIAERYGSCQATIWKKLKQHNIKAREAKPRNSNVPSKEELIELYVTKKLSTWEIEKRHGYCRGTIHRKLKEYRIKRRNLAESHLIYPRNNFSGNSLEKAYLIGFRLGDLRVRKVYDNSETIHVDCGSTIKEQIDLIKSLFEKYGRVWVSLPNKRGSRQIEAFLDLSFSFLLSKTTPAWILRNNANFASFLAGFTDAEGCIGIYSGRAVYRLGNYDNDLLFLIANKLARLGITAHIYNDHNKGYVTKAGYVHNADYWQLVVGKKSHLLNLFNLIGPHIRHENKVKALSKAVNNIQERNKKFGDRGR